MADLWKPESSSEAENTSAEGHVELPQEDADAEILHTKSPSRFVKSWRALQRWPVLLMSASFLLALGIVQLTFHFANIIYRSTTWSQQIVLSKERIAELEKNIRVLKDATENVSDPAYMEQLARCEGFVKENEQIIVSEDAPTVSGGTCVTRQVP